MYIQYPGAVPDFTCYNRRLYIGVDDTAIGGYKSGRDTAATVSFERVLDTGSGSNLPVGGYEADHDSVAARLYRMPASIGLPRFGVYNCIFNPPSVNITTIVMYDNGKKK